MVEQSRSPVGISLHKRQGNAVSLTRGRLLNQRKAWAWTAKINTVNAIAADMVDLDAVRVNFDRSTYAKGAPLLRQCGRLGK